MWNCNVHKKVKQFCIENVCLSVSTRVQFQCQQSFFRYPPNSDGFLSFLAKIKASLIKPRHSKGQEPVSLLGRVIGTFSKTNHHIVVQTSFDFVHRAYCLSIVTNKSVIFFLVYQFRRFSPN